MIRAELMFDIRSYWLAGTGLARGGDVDMVAHRDAWGLPALPGRTVKGLLRDAVFRWEQLGGYDSENELPLTNLLFGSSSDDLTSMPGLLRCSSARLPETERKYLEANPDLAEPLYTRISSTAIDPTTGTAKDKSLRTVEVVVPIKLFATIELVDAEAESELASCWQDYLTPALSLIENLGSNRTRGFGQVFVTLNIRGES